MRHGPWILFGIALYGFLLAGPVVSAEPVPLTSQSSLDRQQKVSDAINGCERISVAVESPATGSAAFLFECARQSGTPLAGVHVEGDKHGTSIRNLTVPARVIASDHTLWPTIIRTRNITYLAQRLGETGLLTQEFRDATVAAYGTCSDARCIAAVFENGYRDRMDFIRAHAAPFPQRLAIDSMMPCATPSTSRRVVISLAPSDAFVSGTVSGIECSMNEPVAIKGELVQNVATLSYAASDGTTRNAVVVVSGDNLYWQALEVTSGLQVGSVDGLIVRLAQRADINATDDGARCTEGPAQPAAFATMRPNRTAECPYGFDELVQRITRLSLTSLPDSVETVERAFGLPEMTTSDDDPRGASYMMILSGKGGWKLLVWVRESFYPLDKGPPAFVPGLRPKRLHNVEDADLRVDLDVLGSSPGSAPGQCVPVSPFLDAIVASGWQDIEMQYAPTTDGGPSFPIFGHESKRVTITGTWGYCAQNITLMQGTTR
jgi:hypothetical protein